MMRVVLKTAEEGSGRLCCVTPSSTSGTVVVDTPACMLYTIAGHLPHLTWDAASAADLRIQNAIYQLTLPTLIDCLPMMKSSSVGIGQFVGLPESSLQYLSYNDPTVRIQSGFNDKNSVSIFCRAGRRRVDASLYEKVHGTFRVDCFQSLADADTPPGCTGKRLNKAVQRTVQLAKSASDLVGSAEVKSDLFISLTGGHSEPDRMQCISELKDLPCSGYVFEGFHLFGDLSDFRVSSIAILLSKCTSSLPAADRLRLFPGALDPGQVVELVRLGMDLFDTSYTHLLTEQHMALVISDDNGSFSTIDLKDHSRSKELTPVSSTCGCYTCRHYTNAYLHHLWKTQELLGPMLLTVHNLHQYQTLFSNIRRNMDVDFKRNPV